MKKETLKRPLVTEKLMNSNEYAFEVDIKANKKEIAGTIKQVFGVDPESVRTIIVKGKSKKTWKSRQNVKVMPWKKAIIRLKKDQKIEMFQAPAEKK